MKYLHLGDKIIFANSSRTASFDMITDVNKICNHNRMKLEINNKIIEIIKKKSER